MTIIAAIILSFTVPTNETIQVHLERNIAESGRQEVVGLITDSNLEGVSCASRFPSPSLEIMEIVSADTDYTLTLESVYDATSVQISVYVVPRSYLDEEGYYWYEAHPGYVYQVEDTSDLSQWRPEGRAVRVAAPEWIMNETGVTNPSRWKRQQLYRVKVRK